jgi:hypothetical protein
MRAILIGWALCSSMLLGSGVALAEPMASGAEPLPAAAAPSAADIARARTLFGEGRALLEKKQWALAEAKFREAATIKNTPGLRYHIALCEENQEHLVEAQTEYLIARGLLVQQPAEDVAALIDPALANLEQTLPRLRIVLPKDIAFARVELDGKSVDTSLLSEPVVVDPGTHVLTVVALEREPFRLELEGRRSEVQTIAVRLAAKAKPQSAPQPTPFAWRTATLIGTATVSAVGLGVGIWGLVERGSAAEEVGSDEARVRERAGHLEGACGAPSAELEGPCADLEDSLDAQDRATGFAVGGLVTTVAGLAATTATLLFWPEESIAVQASLLPERGSVLVSATF